jgi:hypothetical protein
MYQAFFHSKWVVSSYTKVTELSLPLALVSQNTVYRSPFSIAYVVGSFIDKAVDSPVLIFSKKHVSKEAQLEGIGLGATIGDRVGDAVTFTVGETVGLTVVTGLPDGVTDGETVGWADGFAVGGIVELTVGIIDSGRNDKEEPGEGAKVTGDTVDDGLSDSAGEKEEPGEGAIDVGPIGLVDSDTHGIVDGIVDETKDDGVKLLGTKDGPEEVANHLTGAGVGRGVLVSGKNNVTAWLRSSSTSADSHNVLRPCGTLVQSAVYLSFKQYEQVRHCSPFTVTVQSYSKPSKTLTMLDGGSRKEE